VATILTEPAAAALIVVDETDRATLSEIARVTRKPLSTIQRAVDGLLAAGVLRRSSPRAPVSFAASVPRDALRRLAEWRLGARTVEDVRARVHDADQDAAFRPPPTIGDPDIRRAWPEAIEAIVKNYQPERVILFGSQARGDAHRGSDVDLLVVFADLADRRERRVALHRLLGRMPFAKDILVATKDDIARPLPGTALADAVRDGIIVYER
jgi:predicted nucleotidyltransferase